MEGVFGSDLPYNNIGIGIGIGIAGTTIIETHNIAAQWTEDSDWPSSVSFTSRANHTRTYR